MGMHGSIHIAVDSCRYARWASLQLIMSYAGPHRERRDQADDVAGASSDGYETEVPSSLADWSRRLQRKKDGAINSLHVVPVRHAKHLCPLLHDMCTAVCCPSSNLTPARQD
jgi:hypothetical protein